MLRGALGPIRNRNIVEKIIQNRKTEKKFDETEKSMQNCQNRHIFPVVKTLILANVPCLAIVVSCRTVLRLTAAPYSWFKAREPLRMVKVLGVIRDALTPQGLAHV